MYRQDTRRKFIEFWLFTDWFIFQFGNIILYKSQKICNDCLGDRIRLNFIKVFKYTFSCNLNVIYIFLNLLIKIKYTFRSQLILIVKEHIYPDGRFLICNLILRNLVLKKLTLIIINRTFQIRNFCKLTSKLKLILKQNRK